MDLDRLKQHRLRDHRELPEEVYERMATTNPYLKQVHEFPGLLLPHPTLEAIREFWHPQLQQASQVHVEIGCGSGGYLLVWAKRQPQAVFLGFELRYKRLTLAARKLKQAGVTNVLLVKDRGELLGEYLPKQSLDVLHVNFPDPWPKKSHHKHRLFCTDFLNRLQIFLRPGGEIRLKTDHLEYFQMARKLVDAHPAYQLVAYTEDLWNSEWAEENIPTEFERLFKSKGYTNIGFLCAHLQELAEDAKA